jgi:DeoR/GlpR family transcriptional regulator of sugar metabolism
MEERRQAILDLINRQGRVAVAGLSHRFDVSEVTIRADLQALSDRGLIKRTHGGAIPSGYGLPALSLVQRRQQQTAEKARIAQAAAEQVSDGDAIFLDSSSTVLAILPFIRQLRDLTIITNSLVVAQEMLGVTHVNVVMPGGLLHHDTVSLIDPEGLALLSRYHIARGFFGAHGITIEDGLTDVSEAEARFKGPLVKMCRRVVGLMDATKWGRTGIASFAELADVDEIISDGEAPDAMVNTVRAVGVEVSLVGKVSP